MRCASSVRKVTAAIDQSVSPSRTTCSHSGIGATESRFAEVASSCDCGVRPLDLRPFPLLPDPLDAG
jgi:hypothetical protein